MLKQLWLMNLLVSLAFAGCLLLLPTSAHAEEPPISPGDNPGGWEVEALAPHFTAMDFASPDDGWAIAYRSYGNDQTQSSLYHYDGVRWRWQQTFAPHIQLRDVSAVSSGDVWLLSDDTHVSVFHHYDGATWQPITAPEYVLYGIEMLSAQEGYATSENHLWRYDGAGWTAIADSPENAWYTGTDNEFQAVNGENLWLYNKTCNVGPHHTLGDLYNYDNTARSWRPMQMPGLVVNSLSVVSPTLGWAAVGYMQPTMWRYDGSSWPSVPAPPTTNTLETVAGLAALPDQVWAVDRRNIYHYDGASWNTQPQPLLPSDLLVMLAADDGWLGPATHYTGGEWQSSLNLVEPIVFPTVEDYASGVFVLNRNAIWYAGYVYRDGFWRTVPYSITDEVIAPYVADPATYVVRQGRLQKIKMLDAAHGWAVGDIELQAADGTETILHNFLFGHTDGVWAAIATPDSSGSQGHRSLTGFDAFTSEMVWVIGENSAIYRYTGGQWQTTHPQHATGANEPHYAALDMLSANEGWAAGSAFLHYDGQAWQVTQPISDSITAIAMVSSADGWAVGNGGAIYHYDGQSWQPVASPTTLDLNDIAMPGSDGGWAIGFTLGGIDGEARAEMLRYDGVTWQVVATLPHMRLWSISMSDPENGRIAGSEQLLLRLGEPGFLLYLPNILR